MKKYNTERGSTLLKFVDRYIGIPLIFLLRLISKKREVPRQIKNIALLKTAAIGDTVLLTAIISDIQEFNKNIHITLFTGSSNYEFARILEKQYINLSIVKLPIKNPLKAIKIIRQKKYDIFIDFDSWPRLNALLTYSSNASFTIGFKTKNQFRHYLYNKYIEHNWNIHEVENYKNLIKYIGIDKNNLPNIKIDSKKNKKIIVIHMFPGGSKSHLKEWPNEFWIQLINYLTSNNLHVYLTGAPVDKVKALNVKKCCTNADSIFVVAGKYSLNDTINLLSESNFVISIDTGIMHIASALNCNLITLHGPTSSMRWGALNNNSIVINSNLECSPCLNLGFEHGCNINRCMQKISVHHVIEKLNLRGEINDNIRK